MRTVMAALVGTALVVATATPSWADPSEFRFPNANTNGFGQNRGQAAPPRMGGQPFNRPAGGPQGGPQFGGQRFGGERPGQPFGGGFGDRRREFGQRDGYRHRGYGAAIGAGVAGLAAGAIIGGALSNRTYDNDGYDQGYGYAAPDPVYAGPPTAYEDVEPASGDDAADCAQRYRSYDPDSQTYLGFDGDRHPCP